MVLSLKKTIAIALFSVAFLGLSFGSTQVAHAQLCGVGGGLAGGVNVTGYGNCSIPSRHYQASKNPGTAFGPCKVTGLPNGQTISGICSNTLPCCIPTGFTGAGDIVTQTKNQIIQSLVQNLMQKLLGGGAGGGGGGGFSGSNLGTTPKEPDLLSIDTSLKPDDSTGGFLNLNNLLFGAGDTTETVNNDTTEAQNTEVTGTEVAPVQEGDTVESTYELVGGATGNDDGETTLPVDTGIPGTPKDFTEDLFDPFIDFGEDTSSSGSLTREDLERQGLLEAARFGINQKEPQGSLAISYESLTPAEIRSLQDYRGSRVAVSGNLNPFQGQNNASDQLNDEEQKDGFFRKIGRFFSTLFGLGPPTQ